MLSLIHIIAHLFFSFAQMMLIKLLNCLFKLVQLSCFDIHFIFILIFSLIYRNIFSFVLWLLYKFFICGFWNWEIKCAIMLSMHAIPDLLVDIIFNELTFNWCFFFLDHQDIVDQTIGCQSVIFVIRKLVQFRFVYQIFNINIFILSQALSNMQNFIGS